LLRGSATRGKIRKKVFYKEKLRMGSGVLQVARGGSACRAPPEGKMRVIGVKAQKILSKKAFLIAKFILPPSLKNVQIQLFCTSL